MEAKGCPELPFHQGNQKKQGMNDEEKLLITLILLLLNRSPRLLAQPQIYSLNDCIDYAWENSTNLQRFENLVCSKESILEQSTADIHQ
ncbi:MAG: hypothetical protein JXQ65_13750 [Candidatus Marinimicrobia bacterium]|nr:hypothetical protein [Candidatus Neomarinimicrobiota bacterium]